MSELRADTITASDGSSAVTLTKQSASKAWVNFNTNTSTSIYDSFNTSGLTDNGTGDTTQTFTNAMGNANFASSNSCLHGTLVNWDSNITMPHQDSPTTTTIRSQLSNSAASVSDGLYISHVIFGDLA